MARKRNIDEAGAAARLAIKAAKFKKIANRRLPNVIKAIRGLCHLGNRANYHYTAEQVDVMKGRIGKALDRLQQAFSDSPAHEDGEEPIF